MSQDHKVQQVILLLGCSEDDAKRYLDESDGDILKAVESNVVIPVVSGTQHIPLPKKIDDGLDPEVREKLKEARAISDGFTSAHRNDLRGTPGGAEGVAASVSLQAEQVQQRVVPEQVDVSVPHLP
jgi:hypothetical protein